MNELEKLLQKIPQKDRKRILDALTKIRARTFEGLHIQKLVGYECIFRVRVGKYRVIYFDDTQQIILKAIRRRDESTYKNF